MKKLLLAIMLVIAGIGLVACDNTQEKPKEDDDIVEVIPGEDDNKEEETPKEEDKEDKEDEKPEIVDEDKIDYDGVLFFGKDFAQNVSQRVIINVEGYDEIRISIVGNSVFDIPLNMNNWEVDGVKVSHTGVTETSYYTKHQFLIGEVNAVGNLINNFTSSGDLRLHTQHKDKGSNGYIKVDTTNVDEFAFDFKVTTGGFAFIESIRVDFLNTTDLPLEPEIIEEDKEPVIDEEIEEPVIGEDDNKEETPKEDDDIVEVTPVEPEPEVPVEPEPEVPVEPEIDEEDKEPEITEEDESIVYEDRVFIDESNLDKDTFKTVTLDVKGYSQIKITISGSGNIPVNMNNFKIDGEGAEYEGMSKSAVLLDHEFKIGDLDAVGRLININNGDLRLQTSHKDHGKEHYITVNVEGISEFEFQYKVTTTAYTSINSLNIEMTAIEQK